MNNIQLLDSDLIKKIAAGEVVDRPASAVKELIDNSIDAQASKIIVEILSSDGRSFRITDNGNGIQYDDFELAFTLHATSKISNLDDLACIMTKGFRGEALASIISVSDVTVKSKYKDSDIAYEASFNGDNTLQIKETAFNQGTCCEIHDLFRKIPARLNFLKRPETEINTIIDIVKELAVAHPDISFVCKKQGKLIFQTTGSDNWELTVQEAYNHASSLQYIELENIERNILLEGLIGDIHHSKTDPKAIVTIVNNRPIRCPVLRKAIRRTYNGILPSNKYPIAILRLTLPPQDIDVNVHPTKSEIHYKHGTDIFLLTKKALEKNIIINSGAPAFNTESQNISNNLNSQTIEKTDVQQSIVNSDIPPIQSDITPQKTADNALKLSPVDREELFKSKLQDIIANKQQSNTSSISPEVNIKTNSNDLSLTANNVRIKGNIISINECRGNNNSIERLFKQYLYNFQNILREYEDTEQLHITQVPSPESTARPKLPSQLMNEIWQRDYYTCVYCNKHLLHPHIVKTIEQDQPNNVTQQINKDNILTNIHKARLHIATIDHLIPYSQVNSLYDNAHNLYSSCLSCNQEKSNSIDYNKWIPQVIKKAWLSLTIGETQIFYDDMLKMLK